MSQSSNNSGDSSAGELHKALLTEQHNVMALKEQIKQERENENKNQQIMQVWDVVRCCDVYYIQKLKSSQIKDLRNLQKNFFPVNQIFQKIS